MNKISKSLALRNGNAFCDCFELSTPELRTLIQSGTERQKTSSYVCLQIESPLSDGYLTYCAERISNSKTVRAFSFGTPKSRTSLFLTREAFATIEAPSTATTPFNLESILEQLQSERRFAIVQLFQESNRIGTTAQQTVAEELPDDDAVYSELAAEDVVAQSSLIFGCLSKNENARVLDLIRMLGEKRGLILELYYVEAVALQRLGRSQDAQKSLAYLLERQPDHSGAQNLMRLLHASHV